VSVAAFYKDNILGKVVERIEELQERGYRAKDIAILVRNNKEGAEIASHILAHKNNPERNPKYTFDVVTEEALSISSSSAVRFIIACLTMCSTPSDNIAPAVYNKYFGRPIGEPLSPEEQEFIYSISLLQPEEAFNEILLHYPTLSFASEVPYIQALHNQIINFTSKNITDTALFIKQWNASGHKESVALPQDADAITISTIHKSKGLGYPAVIIPSCGWSIRPKGQSTFWVAPNTPLSDKITKFPANISSAVGQSKFSHSYFSELTMSAIDSLNILYVAITRAIRELHIIIPSKYDKNSTRTSSKLYSKYWNCRNK
jgi:ATP-dependent exoDNAse (exonuclease V) beta subunit